MQEVTGGQRFLRREEVLALVGLSRSKLYELMAEGTFPSPVSVGRAVRWVEEEVLSWMHFCVSKRRSPTPLDLLDKDGGAKWFPTCAFMGTDETRNG